MTCMLWHSVGRHTHTQTHMPKHTHCRYPQTHTADKHTHALQTQSHIADTHTCTRTADTHTHTHTLPTHTHLLAQGVMNKHSHYPLQESSEGSSNPNKRDNVHQAHVHTHTHQPGINSIFILKLSFYSNSRPHTILNKKGHPEPNTMAVCG